MPELLDAKTNNIVKDRDRFRLAQELEVPERHEEKLVGGFNYDKVNAERLNQKNENRLKPNYYEQRNKQPEYELDYLDKEIRKANMKFNDAKMAPSRYGGLASGEH